jgi:hypothetical protein
MNILLIVFIYLCIIILCGCLIYMYCTRNTLNFVEKLPGQGGINIEFIIVGNSVKDVNTNVFYPIK